MPIIALAGAKGGTGKTSLTIGLAYELASAGSHVAIADCDPQASATMALRQQPVGDPTHADLVQLEFDFAAGLPEGTSNRVGSLQLIRGGRTLANATREQIRAHLSRASQGADILVIDTAPAIGPVTIGAIELADLILIPLQPAPLPVAGLADLLYLARARNATARVRAVLSMVKPRRRMVEETATRLDAKRPGLLMRTRIPDDAQCERAVEAFEPIGAFAPRSRAAKAVRDLADEVRQELGLAPQSSFARAAITSFSTVAMLAAVGGQLSLFGGVHV